MQSVTELVDCECTDDEWLPEVQNKFRNGRLSVNNHAFLHGEPTTVSGSLVGSQATCGNAGCQTLGRASPNESTGNVRKKSKTASGPNLILDQKCSICKKESEEQMSGSAATYRFREEEVRSRAGHSAINDSNTK